MCCSQLPDSSLALRPHTPSHLHKAAQGCSTLSPGSISAHPPPATAASCACLWASRHHWQQSSLAVSCLQGSSSADSTSALRCSAEPSPWHRSPTSRPAREDAALQSVARMRLWLAENHLSHTVLSSIRISKWSAPGSLALKTAVGVVPLFSSGRPWGYLPCHEQCVGQRRQGRADSRIPGREQRWHARVDVRSPQGTAPTC